MPGERALDALNFFLADVHGGLGPYLAVYLLTAREWNEAEIGVAMSVAGLAGVLAQTPAGALIDATRAKRGVILVAAVAVAAPSLMLLLTSGFWSVVACQLMIGVAGGSLRAGYRGPQPRSGRARAVCCTYRAQ
jgi:predicted MFS family arabinose efflux permease